MIVKIYLRDNTATRLAAAHPMNEFSTLFALEQQLRNANFSDGEQSTL